MVESGQATATPITYNGTPAYKLSAHSSSDTLLNGTAYVARKVVFSAYEYLPVTAANDALLAVTSAHPGATVVNQP